MLGHYIEVAALLSMLSSTHLMKFQFYFRIFTVAINKKLTFRFRCDEHGTMRTVLKKTIVKPNIEYQIYSTVRVTQRRERYGCIWYSPVQR